MRRALSDRHLLGAVLGGDSWLAWRVLLIAAMGEALTDDERSIFAKLTGREREPGERVDELWCVIGRRGGKSRAIAALLVYLATMVDYRSQLVLGERGPVAIYVGIDWRVFGRHEAIRSCGEVNDLIVWFLGEGLPSVDLAHGDLS